MEIKYIGTPENLTLPFFAYGFFKPGQLAYHRIEKYVKDEPLAEIIKHEMKYRDGIPLIDDKENKIFKTTGYLIEFNNPQNAYNKIGNTIREELYEWKEIKVNGRDANALVGVNESTGSFNNRDYLISTYDYRQDSFFNEALELIEDTIKDFEGKDIRDMYDFFNLQMHYMLLWSIIERFCILSYGYFKIGKNMKTFSKEPSFINKLKTINREDVIYSSDYLKDRDLDPHNYRESIRYYYTVRCNVVHKGKTVKNKDRNKLKESLKELYKLFIVVYDEKLQINDELLKMYPEKRS